MSSHYFNTTYLRGVLLNEYQSRAETQDDRILEWFRQNPMISATPEDVQRIVLESRPPLTSARRALSNLTKAGHLEKLPEQRPGSYGRPISFWRLRRDDPDQRRLF